MRSKKSKGVKTFASVPMAVKKFASYPMAVRAAAIGLFVCAVATAMLLAGRQPSTAAQSTAAQLTANARKATQVQAKNTAASTMPAAESAKAVAEEAGTVTITGCLERDAETYRLKDTTGTDAPKSRSWKSGFLKQGAATIEVIDATNTLRLANHVGRRVSVTGTLVDREVHGHSLRRVSSSCG